MRKSLLPCFLFPTLIFLVFQTPTNALEKSYIVYLGAHSQVQNPSSVNTIDTQSIIDSHYTLLASCLESPQKAKNAIFYSYTKHINGFAAILSEQEAMEISKNPNVVSVFLNKGRQLHTTRSWDFLGLEENGVDHSSSLWEKAHYGQDTIIANLDTGVWPESKSFDDEGMGPVPAKWRGICQRDIEDGVHCNRKLIGARYFNKGYTAYLQTENSTFSPTTNSSLFTARDYEGHGSHTLSTAGGNFVKGASVFGNGNGTAKGGSPRARVAAYKVCWPSTYGGQCFDADILAAFDAAISDGVHVLSVSLGGEPSEFFQDGISIGAFHAVNNGIVVVSSAGNSGPSPGTVSNVSPWVITAGATTIDRDFTNYVALGNKKHLQGSSLSPKALPSQKFYPLISGAEARIARVAPSDALLCKPNTIDPMKVKGKILVCLCGENSRTGKGQQAALAGAVGMILANDASSGDELVADLHVLPASRINFTDGRLVFDYLNSTEIPEAYTTPVKTILGVKPAPFMASFSSRGPNIVEPAILKPDITAPGVNIIAAFSEAASPTQETFDKRRVPFNSLSGTSMSCPHVSGIVGLLKTLYPDWSPAAIKSAIMTSARTRDDNKEPLLDSSKLEATPFAYGAGHIQPNRAMDPGLVYDLTTEDYLNFLCARGYNETLLQLFSENPHKCLTSFSIANFNYPSISIPNLSARPTTITRKLKNVGTPGTYMASVEAPAGVEVSVWPSSLQFLGIGEEKTFEIVLKAKVAGKSKDYEFGQLTWSDGKHYVRSPIVVNHE
ncbi:hypothetical protein UlMin_019442 [Ulmus minor]